MISSRLSRTSNLSNAQVVYWSHGTSHTTETPCRQRFHCCPICCKMIHTKGPDALGKCLFILRKKSVINSLRQVRPVIHQILSRLTKLQRRCRPASEQDKFLSGVKSDRFVNLHAMTWRKMSIKKIWSKPGRFVPRYALWRFVRTVQLLRFLSLR